MTYRQKMMGATVMFVAAVVMVLSLTMGAQANHGHHSNAPHKRLRTVVCALLAHERQAHPGSSDFAGLPKIGCGRLR